MGASTAARTAAASAGPSTMIKAARRGRGVEEVGGGGAGGGGPRAPPRPALGPPLRAFPPRPLGRGGGGRPGAGGAGAWARTARSGRIIWGNEMRLSSLFPTFTPLWRPLFSRPVHRFSLPPRSLPRLSDGWPLSLPLSGRALRERGKERGRQKGPHFTRQPKGVSLVSSLNPFHPASSILFFSYL